MKPIEAWLGGEATRNTIFRARDGTTGRLAECYQTGRDSAHPGRRMFRLGDSLAWHWEMGLEVVASDPRKELMP